MLNPQHDQHHFTACVMVGFTWTWPQGGLVAPNMDMDPREAILRHADKKDVFSSFTSAYADTQPKPIFAQEEEEEEEDA